MLDRISQNIEQSLDVEVTNTFNKLEDKQILEGLLKASIKIASQSHPHLLPSLNQLLNEVMG